ncbi:MAG: hypothetical protein JSW39_19570, partial [Desulfobacterales bacterium]
MDRVVQKVAAILEMQPAEVCKPGNQPQRVKARSLVCYWAVWIFPEKVDTVKRKVSPAVFHTQK